MANEDRAKDPTTPPEVLAMLATSPSDEVRLLIAQNPNTPNTALLHLARDENDDVRKTILKRTQVSSEVLRVAALPRESLSELEAPPTPVITPPPAPKVQTPPPAPDSTPAPTQQAAAPAPVSAPAPAAASPEAPKRSGGFMGWLRRLFGMRD